MAELSKQETKRLTKELAQAVDEFDVLEDMPYAYTLSEFVEDWPAMKKQLGGKLFKGKTPNPAP